MQLFASIRNNNLFIDLYKGTPPVAKLLLITENAPLVQMFNSNTASGYYCEQLQLLLARQVIGFFQRFEITGYGDGN